MIRTPVDSSNVHSHGHDATGLEIQFHAAGCARTIKAKNGDRQAACNCGGGAVYHYPGFPAEEYAKLAAAPSVGAHFMQHIRFAKTQGGGPKYPHVKREA